MLETLLLITWLVGIAIGLALGRWIWGQPGVKVASVDHPTHLLGASAFGALTWH